MRLINKRFKTIIDRIIFHTPPWKRRHHIEVIKHLPIRILKISQIFNCNWRYIPIYQFHLALTHFILDVDQPEIDPGVVITHPETMFFISVNHLRRCRYDKSLFMWPNVKLFTNDSYFAGTNWKTLTLYKDFTFSTLTISHIEICDEMPDMLELLSGFKIERLILDRFSLSSKTFRPLDPIKLIKFQNIIHFSSTILDWKKIFPLFLVNKLPNLESFHCSRETFLNFNEFKLLQMKSIDIALFLYWDHVSISNFSDNSLSRIFHNRESENVSCRYDIIIHLKDPPKHLQFLQNIKLW